MGLIPAWAGKTMSMVGYLSVWWAHPRVGGENACNSLGALLALGSSPRGRGKPGDVNQRSASIGLIPAWAGKTVSLLIRICVLTAHPRVGGENSRYSHSSGRPIGSSPRGRGKPSGPRPPRRRRGLIPAWAGKTHVAVVHPLLSGAHPRVGGENARVMRVMRVMRARKGSSPRGRGKHPNQFRDPGHTGLIPAWAGKTRQ